MDYEKKYRDLVEAVKELQEANPSDEGIQKWVEDNVPELAESEDERIRRELIGYFNRYKEEQEECGIKTFYGISTDDILAWLEKQSAKEVDARYENLEELLVADNIYQMSMNEAMVEEAKSKAIKALSELSISKLLGLEKQGKQKPAEWSEEDEHTLNGIIDEIEANKASAPDYDLATYDSFLSFLESLKERIGG